MRRLLVLVLLLAGCAAPATPTVVTLGDSVPAGSACGCTPFPALYARSRHATDVNLAAPGSTAADVRAALPAEQAVLASASEVVIMTGANDIAAVFDDPTSYAPVASTVEADVTATVEAVSGPRHIPVIVLGYWNVVRNGQPGAAHATDLINTALRKAAETTGATYVPTGPAFAGDPAALLAADGDHPNAAGQAAIAALLSGA